MQQIQKTLCPGRRQSCPALRLRSYQDRLEEERAQWNRKYKDFLAETESFKSEMSPASSHAIEWPTGNEDMEDTLSSSEESNVPQQTSEYRTRRSKQDIWSALSAPKRPIPPIRALRAKYTEAVDNRRQRDPRHRRSGHGLTLTPWPLDIPRVNLSHSDENDPGENNPDFRDITSCGSQGLIAPRSPRLSPSPRLKRLSRIDLSLDVSSQFTSRSGRLSPAKPT